MRQDPHSERSSWWLVIAGAVFVLVVQGILIWQGNWN
jgi:hypothetical protein